MKATPSLVAFAKHGDGHHSDEEETKDDSDLSSDDSDEEVESDTNKSNDKLASGGGDTLDTGPKLEPVFGDERRERRWRQFVSQQ